MAGEKQPIGVRTFDYAKKVIKEGSGVAFGRKVAKNNKIVDIADAQLSVDLKGACVVAVHSVFPLAARGEMVPNSKGGHTTIGLYADMAAFVGTAAIAITQKDGVAAAGLFAGIKAAEHTAIVVVPDLYRATKGVLIPLFQRQPPTPNNSTQ